MSYGIYIIIKIFFMNETIQLQNELVCNDLNLQPVEVIFDDLTHIRRRTGLIRSMNKEKRGNEKEVD